MTRMDNLKFMLKAMEAIRRATSCRVIELLDSFVANNTIEHCVNILKGIGKAELHKIEDKAPDERTEDENIKREIQINCQCIFIQLSYRAQNIKRLERLDGM